MLLFMYYPILEVFKTTSYCFLFNSRSENVVTNNTIFIPTFYRAIDTEIHLKRFLEALSWIMLGILKLVSE